MNRAAFDEEPEGRDEEAGFWCMRLAEDKLGPDEQRAFDEWLADAGNAEALDEAIQVWRAMEAVASRPEIIHARAEALDTYRKGHSRRWMRAASRRWYWPVGAVAAILLVVGSMVMFHDPSQVYETGIGERRVAMLDDGSRLSLDAASDVKVDMAKERRQITLLAGRAKFDVAHDPLRPFTVAAGNKLVVATGTSFSVELLQGQVRVLLYEGHVEVLDRSDGTGRLMQVGLRGSSIPAETALRPGRELVVPLNLATATVTPADVPRSLSWEGGQMSFEDEPLPSAIERFNRYSQEPLKIGDPSLSSLRVNGVFDAGNTDTFVEGLSALHAIHTVHANGEIVIKK